MTTLIKNGTIITAADTYRADILVKNGRVFEIGREISKIANEIIDATGKWVLPGAVDAHTHLGALCDGMAPADDFASATAAAAVGGTTTVIDYAEQAPGGRWPRRSRSGRGRGPAARWWITPFISRSARLTPAS